MSSEIRILEQSEFDAIQRSLHGDYQARCEELKRRIEEAQRELGVEIGAEAYIDEHGSVRGRFYFKTPR